jgi:hypothetical protein
MKLIYVYKIWTLHQREIKESTDKQNITMKSCYVMW